MNQESPEGSSHSRRRRARFAAALRLDTTSGVVLLAAAAVAFAWANSPWRAGYTALTEFVVGPSALHLDLSIASWAADGLLAIFFFLVGLELKHEMVAGDVRNPRQAAVPMLAAVGGMVVPAAVFVAIVAVSDDPSALHGWAIPAATDIAFALGVLAVLGRGLPMPLRTFLLTLAVVDDLLAIIVIALFYTASIHALALAAALCVVVVFGVLVRTRAGRWFVLLPVAALAWWLMHESGVHATIAGVLLGLTVPARALLGERTPRTERYEALVRPVSTAVVLPVFALLSAGVTVVGGGFAQLAQQPVFLAIVVALVVGKIVGVLGTTALVVHTTRLRLPDGIGVRDLVPIGFLTGIGFTVSLLITELSFPDSTHTEAARLGILLGSLIAGTAGGVTLRWVARRPRSRDMNDDGIPDEDWPRIGDTRS